MFFFFPALLPLAELLPWVAGLLAAVAGVAGFSFPVFWRKYRRVILTGLLLCGMAAGYAWYKARPDPAVIMTGTAPVPVADYPAAVHFATAPDKQDIPAGPFRVLWNKPQSAQILSSPVVDGALVLYGSYGGSVEAQWRQDGAAAWSLPLKGPVTALTPGAAGVVYAGEGLHETASSVLTAIDTRRGRVLWQRSFLGHLESEGTLDEKAQRLWISAGPGGLWALRTADGAVLWHAPLGHIDSAALLDRGRVYIAADTGESEDEHRTVFFALSADRGRVIWQLPLPGQPWGSALRHPGDDLILMTTGTGQIGVNRDSDRGWAQGIRTDGTLAWQVELPAMALQPALYYAPADLVIHTTKTGGIIALHARSGKVAWQAAQEREFRAPAIMVTGEERQWLVASAHDGILTVRDPATGQEIVRGRAGLHGTAAPVAAGDMLYVAGSRTMTGFAGLAAWEAAHER
jgi:outer membrane protein assembly factor BamB